MDRLSPTDSNTNVIVNSLVGFLDPETTRMLRASTKGYKQSVSGAGSMQFLARRRVQEIAGEMDVDPVAAQQHDWDLTYRLLTTDPFALYYTGNEVDAEIARRMGALMPDDKNTTVNSVVWHMENAAGEGWVDVFKTLLKEEEGKLDNMNWQAFIAEALCSNKLDILSLEEMKVAMSTMSLQDISGNLENVVDWRVSPFVADFFLSHAQYPSDRGVADSAVYQAIKDGNCGLMKVFLKHDIVSFESYIDGSTYIDGADDHYGENWNVTWLAAKHGRLNILQLLLTDPRTEDIELQDYALEEPVKRGYVEIVRLMLSIASVDVQDGVAYSNGIDNAYLSNAVLSDSLDMVKLLLSYNSVYFQSVNLQAALATAVDNDYVWIAVTLLKDPRVGSMSSEVRKHLMVSAEFNGNEMLVKMLLALE